VGDLSEKIASPTTAGSGWAQALTSAGYVAQAYHFYPKGETRSVCQTRLRRYRPPTGSLPDGVRKCPGCQEWISGHPDGGTRNYRTRSGK